MLVIESTVIVSSFIFIFQYVFPLELHLVHVKESANNTDPDRLAVLGILFKIQDEDNTKINELTDALEKVKFKDDKFMLRNTLPLVSLMPEDTDEFYRYQGSLTTPGCNEIVVWTVFKVLTLQGVPLTFFTFQKPKTQNVLTLDPELIKPKCV